MRPWLRSLALYFWSAVFLVGATEVYAGIGSGRLLIAGTRLTVSPEAQTVPFNTPTIVETHLQGYDAEEGTLPSDLRVLADLTGPEIDGVMVLETVPGEPFRIPRLSLKGQYQLDNIRLVEGDELLAYAEPRSAGILVTQVLVTRVTSRPLSLDELRSYGVVVDNDNFRAFNFTFGFGVDGQRFDYNLPVVYEPHGGVDAIRVLTDQSQLHPGGSSGTTAQRFVPPQLAPFHLKLESGGDSESQVGGCMDPEGDCYQDAAIPLPGVILFPTDVTVLHQFFSVVLIAKNDAPEGDPLRIRDLTARVVLPSALRMAETEPPTPLGVPVPIRVPGPDGQLGTGDDLTFLIAQAEGQAEVVVESLRQGTHFVEFQLEGVLEGLPSNEVRRVTGSARGAVVVRDPTLGVTITHPDVVRTDEEYPLLMTISNTSNAPVNLITLTIPPSGVSGAQILGENSKTIPTLPPGESEVVEFRVRSLRTGKVIASSIRSGSEIDPRFEFTVGVGENGIPLSPTSLILPRTTDALPPLVARRALAMLGLGYSLATLPASAQNDHPRIGIEQFHEKVYWLSQAGRHVSMGEEPFDSLAVFAMEWSGARDKDWEWDKLRRTTQKGGLLGDALAQTFAAEAAETTPVSAFERFAATTAFLGKLQGALATGDGAVLEVVSRSSGKAVQGGGTDPARIRTLPFADLYDLGQAEMVFLGVPEENGYQAVLRDTNGGSPALHILVPDAAGDLRIVTWGPVVLSADGVATVDFRSSYDTFILKIDSDGDGVFESERPATERTIAPRPFTALAAVQNNIDPSGHIVELLLTQDIDLASLLPVDPNRFTIPGKVSNGGLVPVERDVASFFETLAENPFEGLRDTRIVRVIFDNPISPYVENRISVRDLRSVSGQQVVNVTLPVRTTVTDEGTIVRGTVYGPDGQPVPFAKVELHEVDFYYFALDNPCRKHLTAAVQADAGGRFLFDYVRKTQCTDVFSLVGHDLAGGKHGSARGRVRFVGQEVHLDIVMLGRGSIRGRVRYEDGSVPETLEVVAYSPVFFEGRKARVSADGSYEVGDVPVGTITLGAADREGSFVYQTVEIPTAGAVVQRDLTIIRRAPTQATGDIRGVVYETDGTTPVYNAYLALYLDGELAGVQRSDPEGRFDFGTVPVGRAEIEGFDAETGLTGVQVFFDVLADQVNNVTLRLRDDRGTVEGHVYLQSVTGTRPLAGAVVWVTGTPFNTVTDANGYYRLDGVFAGSRQVLAADLARNRQTSAPVSVSANTTVARDLYFVDTISGGLMGEVIGFNGSPVPFALVHLANGYDQWYAETTTDASGRFVFPNLGVGTYEVHAIKGSDGGKAFATIRFQGETPFMRIQFKQGSIRGVTRARNESGNLVGVRSLVIYRPTAVRGGLVGLDWEPHTLETNGDGTFVIPDVLVGNYVLTVTNAFHGEKTVRDELVFHGEVGEHEFVFERNGTIRGVVYDWDGTTPVANAKVDLRHPNFSAYDLRTDAEGRFKFELVPPGGRFPIDAEIDAGAIFRKARVWVNFTRFGQEMDVEITLQRQGSVIGFVEDSNGVAVAGAVVTLKEHAFPHRTIVQNADRDGYFSFTNIFAGPVSIDAKAPSLGGLGARTSVEIVSEGEEATALLVLEATGEITGKVLSPVDGQPVSAAQVDLLTQHGGLFDSVTTDAQGVFRFRLLPLSLYGLRAFDPKTGRHGSRDSVRVEFNNHVMEADVTLEVRGEVDGHLYEPNSTVGIPGATVRMETRSLVHFTTYSSTDVNGYFEFLGVPQGPFKLSSKEPEGRRTASGTGEITAEGERVTVDLYLEASGKVKGSVFNPQGIPDGLFPNANTLIYQDGQVVGATLANPFEFPGIIAVREFELRTFEIGGEHKATAKGTLTTEGEEVTVDLRMVPIGDTTIVVQDSFGSPVSGAEVTVKNNGFYREKTFVGTTDASGRAVFRDLGKGTVSAYAKHPVTQLRGSGNGVIELEDQMLEVVVRLEDSGQIRGRAVKSDGVTPAADALVVVTRASRTLQTLADANGDFSFVSVPLGAFKVFVQERLGPGNIERAGTVAANGQVVDVGTLVLDDAPPYVVSLEPLGGTRDLPLSTIVTIRFNERLDRARFSGSWLVFRTLSGRWVNHSLAWVDNDSTLVLTPTSPLESFTGYEVIVNDGYDPAGRRLSDRVKTVFHTVDVVPPAVVDVLPRNGQKQVAVDAQVKVTFSEPVAFASLSGSAFQLTDLTTGQGVTTTFLHLFGEREVLLTPADALTSDHEYRLTVQNVRDKGGNAMPQPVSTNFFTVDTIPPQITAVGFPDGTSFTAGDDVPVTVEATDRWGVKRTAVRVGAWTFADETAPFAVTAVAPIVAQERDVTLTIEATDVHGNTATTERTIRVSPLVDANAPQIVVECASDGSPVLPGIEAEFRLRASDDDAIESLAFSVDGVELRRVELVNQPQTLGSFVWMPPANAAPGAQFAIRLEARDFAGNVTAEEFHVAVPTGTVLKGGRSLNSTYDGQALTLVNGTFILRAPLTLPSLTIMRGAKLVAPQQGDVRLDVQGAFTVQCGATLDASGAGYLGGTSASPIGGAPAGVAGSRPDAGGSHGGHGSTWTQPGPAGDVYDSVYEPRLGGGGGSLAQHASSASAGGGVVDLEAGELVLEGEIRARGAGGASYRTAGAGGTVVLRADRVRGAGVIDASGGNTTGGSDEWTNGCSNGNEGSGGGGRVALYVGAFQGFDPQAQVKAWGGAYINCTTIVGYAAPGTVFIQQPGQTYGKLIVDSGEESSGTDRVGLPTRLPALGSGAVADLAVSGADAWLQAAAALRGEWLGAWVVLLNGGGQELGAFRVAALDEQGRLRLAGAGSVQGAASYRGEYRFDAIDLRHGAGLDAGDPVVAETVVLDGDARTSGEVRATTVLVKSGAVVRPAAGGRLRFVVSGTMTVEQGARLDAVGLGYPGGTAASPTGGAPAGVAGSQPDAGGSHGGHGSTRTQPGPAGDVYDSVYEPSLGGGGGSLAQHASSASAGGGVVELEVGELVLEGEIRSRGVGGASYRTAGAGGTVVVRAGRMSGAGLIDASGGNTTGGPDEWTNGCSNGREGSGGGGRVALHVGTFEGFDPGAQVKAWGGSYANCTTIDGYAAPGTVFVKQPEQTYGKLIVDSGEESNGTDRVGLPTRLPALGSGAIAELAVSGADSWLRAAAPLRGEWLGAWVVLLDVGGQELGAFRVAALDEQGRLRLAGAGGVQGAASYRGEYRFDAVDLWHGAGLDAGDPVVSTEVVLDGNAKANGEVRATTVLVKSGAVVRPAAGGRLRFVVSGTMTVEQGARLDVVGLGYPGGTSASPAGGAPAGVAGSQPDAGGSHGGHGSTRTQPGPAGEVYDSVYEPRLGGGGGSLAQYASSASAGGGVVELEVGELALEGEIRARGVGGASYRTAGAGGTVVVRAGRMSGAGLIDASGGNTTGGADEWTNGCSNGQEGSGGGGRVALHVGTFEGFDPGAQVKAWGGSYANCTTIYGYAAPGTIFIKQPEQTYGRLIIDSGEESNGTDRVGLPTKLPALGGGSVAELTAAGADAWLQAAAPLRGDWLGAWVVLKDSAGADLQAFRVAALDGQGRALLAGAGGVQGAASYRGEYRFDTVDLRHGAGLLATDPIVGPALVLEGNAEVTGEVQAVNVLVKSGAVVRPAAGGSLRFVVSGTMTVEQGARLDVVGLGYAGGTAAASMGGAPAGVAGSQPDAGGSHGGHGSTRTQPGPAGEVYDSVYEPRLGGGGGSLAQHASSASAGGGVIELEVGELVLEGEIRARGVGGASYRTAGAGGTVVVRAGQVRGAGLIDASGGNTTGGSDEWTNGCSNGQEGSGGGGRVALHVGTFIGFDPGAQVKAWGGSYANCTTIYGYAAPGTVFVKQPEQTYGKLIVDSGEESNGTDRVGLPTRLPALGSGAIAELVASGADAWLRAAAPLRGEWLGVWVVLLDGGGQELGAFRVAALDEQGRLRLAGAGGVQGAASYRGEYRFDNVDLRHGAGLDAGDPVVSTEVVLDGNAKANAEVRATTVLVKSGAVVRPAAGGRLRFAVSGKMTVEAGARLDVVGLGYPGGTSTSPTGGAPAGVAGSQPDAGGSHGGHGSTRTQPGPAGEVYDSVYEPRLGGGGGSLAQHASSASAGGGVVELEVGELVLEGEIRARGVGGASYRTAGAGGTVVVRAGQVRGAGLIDASGGNTTGGADEWTNGCSNGNEGSGGGGRVALYVGTFEGFDPGAQVKAWGGSYANCTTIYGYAAPGTVFVKQTEQTYGKLTIDSGEESNGADRLGPVTRLPALGSGAVVELSASGADAWLRAAAPLRNEWLGAWVVLLDGGGQELGAFRVAALDEQGRLRLAEAGGVQGAASYRGEYRFDAVDLWHGAGLDAGDPVISSEMTFDGNAEANGEVRATTVLVKGGAVVRPATGGRLRFVVSGTMTVEAGARLDVVGLGYQGGTSTSPTGGAPAGVAGSQPDAGGSHGGQGAIWTQPGPAGEVYDSVYQPRLGGGGGSLPQYGNSSAGGGVVELEVGELVLEGEIRARGAGGASYRSAGAGGTVVVLAGQMRGAGLIDASGGNTTGGSDEWTNGCSNGNEGSGGGGRVALYVGTFQGFDPQTRVKASGGSYANCTTTYGYAAPGTVFVKQPQQTYGTLRVDQGSTGGKPIATTALPSIGKGTIGAIEVHASDPAALWIEPADPNARFGLGATGMWVRVNGVDYRVVDQSADRRRLLLAGAGGAVSAGQTYVGFYKFDAVTVRGYASLVLRDGEEVGSWTIDSGSAVTHYDLTPPAAAITAPAAGSTHRSGQPIQAAATATDNVAVTSVTFRLGDQVSAPDTAAPYEWTVTAPLVEVDTDMTLTVEAVDAEANKTTVTRTVRVQPIPPGNPPIVAFTCPTPGALLAPGTGLDLNVTATHDDGVERVELVLGSDPAVLATDTQAPYTFRFTAPAGAQEGDILQVKARARAYSGVYGEAVYLVTVVQGSVLTADTTLAASDLSLDGQSVVVAGGTLTISGMHNFRDLVVLDGAKVTHAETTATQAQALEVGVERDLYVACGGAIDATARGYLGAPANQRAYGYGNVQTEGAQARVGGSHGGRGGRFDGSSPVYGSVFDPRDPGAGGGYDGSTKGRDGGGVVRFTVLGDAVIDGSVLADGESGATGGGAGGSIRLNAVSLTGAGRIQANGSAGATGSSGGGSGGRVALYAASVDSALLGRVRAAGTRTTSTDASYWGAAGTVYVKLDSAPFGELILDNAGTASTQYTDLPAVRPGVVDSVAETSFTDHEADFRRGLEGIEVAFNDDFSTLYTVTGNGHHGQALSLEVPAPPLSAVIEPGDTYRGIYRFDRVVVRGGARALSVDQVTSTTPAEVAAGSTWTESYAPTVQLTSPAAGAVFHSGDVITLTAAVQDVLGVRDVVLRFGAQSATDSSSPYSWSITAPPLSQPSDFPVSATMTDHAGNRITAAMTVHVDPVVDPTAPVVTLTGCTMDGDALIPGTALSIPFTATDNSKVRNYSLVVDGQVIQTTEVNQPSVTATLSWTPPANAAPGTTWVVRVEATDFAGGLGFASWALKAPSTTVRTGNQSLTSALDGQEVFLGAGTFTVQGPLQLASLTLLKDARLVGLAGQTLALDVTGELRVQCGGAVDAGGLGYTGGTAAAPSGRAPAGVTGAGPDAGGSHGGPGGLWNLAAGPVGPTYDSVYAPHLAGGGGALDNDNSGDGYPGGGVIDIVAGQVVLGGEIRARGVDNSDAGRAAGAGGTVRIDAGALSGKGLIDASGGYTRSCTASRDVGQGGGGRVALYVDQISGFNLVSQVRVWGGTLYDCYWNVARYAGPGTLYVREPSAIYGKLVVASGEETSGADRVGPSTELPALGNGAVTAFEASGADAWVTASSGFAAQWLGAWMKLLDAGGQDLGTYPVAQIDAQGRVRLSGASAVTGAAAWRGEYRFDKVELWHGAGLVIRDRPLIGDLQTDGSARLFGDIETTTMTVKAGSVVTAPEGQKLHLKVQDRLTIEAGARLDVTGVGYAGGKSGSPAGGAPAGVTGAGPDAGGSHGGSGGLWNLAAGPVGPTYDSVYAPHQSGGGGALDDDNSGDGYAGGGIVEIEAGELVLNGEIRARGLDNSDTGRPAGAGGTVRIDAGLLSGTGLIDASGGYTRSCTGSRDVGQGGGGRVALYVDQLSGFNPVSQVRVWGGTLYDCYWNIARYAGPGTIFVQQTGATYGKLIVDSGEETNGADRVGPSTELPALGGGSVTAFEASGTSARVAAATPFKAQWLGAWMTLLDAAGGELGTFQVLEIDAQGRVLLADAGAVTGAASWRGDYRFDQVELWRGAGLIVRDTPVVGSLQTDGTARLFGNVQAGSMTVKAGSVVTLPEGERMRLAVSGQLRIEAGARLDVTGRGYAGGKAGSPAGGAPAGVTGAGPDAGGSHGGSGGLWNLAAGPVGPTYDSVYLPHQSGGGGALDDDNSGDGYAGGGIVEIAAGSLVLDGEIRARGLDNSDTGRSAGAGGTVRIDAGALSGAGLIDASGGYTRSCTGSRDVGQGGGGRVALYVDQLSGFNPLPQVRVWGGTLYDCYWNIARYAGPGTVFVKDQAATYGKLIVDSGEETNGADRVGPSTELPALGSGSVTAFEASGADAWVTAAATFKRQWLGARMALLDTAGAVLDRYQVVEIDAAGRARLAGASAATGVASYRGEYHFDRVELWRGAGLIVRDQPVVGELQTDGAARLYGNFKAGAVTLKASSVVTVPEGERIRFDVSGRLTVEAGARLDVTGIGYAGGKVATPAGGAPAGVTGSGLDAGGSHGGAGSPWNLAAGPAGEVYDSVYSPYLAGGGGALDNDNSGDGFGGGGVVKITAAEVQLDGEIRAKGTDNSDAGRAAGGGGTVWIDAGQMSGAGLIDVTGGYSRSCTGSRDVGVGGGGRVALYVDQFPAFDPLAQVKSQGGVFYDCYWNHLRYGGPGTVYLKTLSSTHGRLKVDQGGTGGRQVPNTPLPSIGAGTIGATEIDAADVSALWIEPSDPAARFALGAVGMWVRVDGTDYRVIAQTADRRRLLLAGAAGIVDAGDAYRGVYKLDEVIVRGGAKLEFRDTNEVVTFTVDGTSSVIQNVP